MINSRNPNGVNPGPVRPGLTPLCVDPVDPREKSRRLDFAVIYDGVDTFSQERTSNFH